jgi:hypothetical protein
VKFVARLSVLLLMLLTAGEVLADAEVESNNTAGTANTLTSGVTMNGHLSSASDVDYFNITVGSSGTLEIQTSGYPRANVEVLNPSQQLIGTGEIWGTDTFSVGFAQSGAYYIRVVSKDNYTDTDPYNLTVTISGDAPSAPTISLSSKTSTSATIAVASNGEGASPITSYSLSCEIPALAPSELSKSSQESSTQWVQHSQPRPYIMRSAPKSLQMGSSRQLTKTPVGRLYSPIPELTAAVVGDLLEFEAPSGSKEQGQIIRAEFTKYGNYLVHAKSAESEMVAVVTEDGNFISRVSGPSGVFQSQILEGNSVVYSEADGELVDNPFINDMLVHEFTENQNQDIAPAELSANPTVISVGVQYDNATRDAYDEIALAEYYVYLANQSYQASDVDIKFEIVGTRNYEPYISNSSLEETLRYITCGTTSCSPAASYNSNVKAWRDQVKADLVVQLVRYGITSGGGGTQCGIAWTPATAFSFLFYLPELTYSVSAVEGRTGYPCPYIAVAHEMGHNLGLFHDRQTDAGSGDGPYYSYARGYKVDSTYGTVMSYTPIYIYALSNPNKTYNGSPIGIPIGQSGEAFAAQAVANVMPLYEDIYENTTATYYTVTANAGSGGSISPSSASVREGNTASFTVTPNTNYTIDSVTGCNGTLSGSKYTTGAVTGPCAVTASFQRYRWSQTTSGNSVTFTGLPTGYQFSCTGFATSSVGDSPNSNSIVFTTQEPEVPSRPTIERSDFADGDIYLHISVSSDGGSAITGYTATCTDGTNTFTGTSTSSPITVSGLTNGVAYTCTVTATNSVGTSLASGATSPITPEETSAGLPIWLLYQAYVTSSSEGLPTGIPTNVTITRSDFGDGEITLWVTADEGGSAITGYDASCTDGTNTYTGTSTSSPIIVSGLTNDVAYTCTVTATNSVGTSSPSAATAPVTPEETPNGLPIWLLYEVSTQ